MKKLTAVTALLLGLTLTAWPFVSSLSLAQEEPMEVIEEEGTETWLGEPVFPDEISQYGDELDDDGDSGDAD